MKQIKTTAIVSLAAQAADICGVNRDTVNRYYNLLRRAILSENEFARGKSHVNGIENF